jgi:hypothetical protein
LISKVVEKEEDFFVEEGKKNKDRKVISGHNKRNSFNAIDTNN